MLVGKNVITLNKCQNKSPGATRICQQLSYEVWNNSAVDRKRSSFTGKVKRLIKEMSFDQATTLTWHPHEPSLFLFKRSRFACSRGNLLDKLNPPVRVFLPSLLCSAARAGRNTRWTMLSRLVWTGHHKTHVVIQVPRRVCVPTVCQRKQEHREAKSRPEMQW